IARMPGFAAAMIEAGWLVSENGILRLPDFDTYMGKSGKKRAQTARRVSRHRNAKCNASDVTDALAAEQKRTVLGDANASPIAGASESAPKPKRSRPSPRPAKAPAEPSAQRRFTDYFTGKWRNRYGTKYPFQRGKDGTASASVMRLCDGKADLA